MGKPKRSGVEPRQLEGRDKTPPVLGVQKSPKGRITTQEGNRKKKTKKEKYCGQHGNQRLAYPGGGLNNQSEGGRGVGGASGGKAVTSPTYDPERGKGGGGPVWKTRWGEIEAYKKTGVIAGF